MNEDNHIATLIMHIFTYVHAHLITLICTSVHVLVPSDEFDHQRQAAIDKIV